MSLKHTPGAKPLVCIGLLSLQATVNELKIIISVLNYLTVLVYTKIIIHFSVAD